MITTRILHTHEDQVEFLSKELKAVIPFFNVSMMGFRTYIVALNNDVVVGIASLTEESVWYENCLGVGYISTHTGYRNQGVSKALVDALFQYAVVSNKNISNTSYEPDGKAYLRHVMARTAKQHPSVTLIERD